MTETSLPAGVFSGLRRWPDVEAPNLQAYDTADALLLERAAPSLTPGTAVSVIGDAYGALTLGAVAAYGLTGLRVHQDPLSGEQALERNARSLGMDPVWTHHPLSPALVGGAQVVLLRLPRSLDALDEAARLIAEHADPGATVYAGGRIKHMSRGMNDVLGRYFESVTAGLAKGKSRVLTAERPVPGHRLPPSRFPLSAEYELPVPVTAEAGAPAPGKLRLRAYGAAFGGAALDPGTRFLLPHLHQARKARHAIDLGCGTGTIAAALALSRPGIKVTATDQSAAAVASATETMRANGVAGRVEVIRDDALSTQPDASCDLILLNPPFHIGASVHTGIALKLFADAGRVLRPGGELWTVWNSHLAYRPALNRLVGPTRQVDRNPKFTVAVSVRR